MHTPRISASSYSNTAPLIWSFLYGSQHGCVELVLDNSPARSAELLSQGRVHAALVPVIAYHSIGDARLVPDVCVGAKEKVRSVCVVTGGRELSEVRSVALDVSSRTSVVLTKIIFREFFGFEPEWRPAEPDIESMLSQNDAALLIGDPALSIPGRGSRIAVSQNADADSPNSSSSALAPGIPENAVPRRPDSDSKSAIRNPQSAIDDSPQSAIKKFDLAELWKQQTGHGFVFAMWMTCHEKAPIDFATARDEGLERIDEIVSNYLPEIGISLEDFRRYLSEDISYTPDEDLLSGMNLYFDLARKHRLIDDNRDLKFTT